MKQQGQVVALLCVVYVLVILAAIEIQQYSNRHCEIGKVKWQQMVAKLGSTIQNFISVYISVCITEYRPIIFRF